MTKKSTYFKLGLFIISSVAIAIAAIAILAGPNFFRPKAMFETYFIYSISGLEEGSPVKFRGIPVGQVKQILLSSEAYPGVGNEILSEKDTVAVVRMELYLPSDRKMREELEEHIKKGLRVQTQLAGITGSLYLSMEFLDPEKYPADRIQFSWKPKYTFIPSAPSLSNEIVENVKVFLAGLDHFDLDQKIQEITPVFNELVDNLKNLAGKLNPETINRFVANVDKLVETTNDKVTAFDVENLNKLIKRIDSSAKSFEGFAENSDFQQLTASLTKLSNRLDMIVKTNQHDFREALQNLESAMSNLNLLLKELQNNPRQFFMGPSNNNIF